MYNSFPVYACIYSQISFPHKLDTALSEFTRDSKVPRLLKTKETWEKNAMEMPNFLHHLLGFKPAGNPQLDVNR